MPILYVRDSKGNFVAVPGIIGPRGPQGQGTSAYEAAKEAGYTGTEEEFNAALADIENKASKTEAQAMANAAEANIKAVYDPQNKKQDVFAYTDKKVEPLSRFLGIELPDGYTQVQYIESTGTQYIDTGLRLNQDSKLEMSISHYTTDTQRMAFGSRTNATENNFSVISGPVGGTMSLVVDFDNYTNNRLSYVIDEGELLEISVGNEKLSINDSEKDVATYGNFTTPENAYIFNGSGTYPGGYAKAIMRLYYCKIYQGDSVVRDFVPCYRNSDGVVGMYDLATKTFYSNAGTGEFISGSKTPIISIENGGTGAATAEDALANLGAASKTEAQGYAKTAETNAKEASDPKGSAAAAKSEAIEAAAEDATTKANNAETNAKNASVPIVGGTMMGALIAASGGQSHDTSLLRNSKLVSVETNPTVNGEICWTYE